VDGALVGAGSLWPVVSTSVGWVVSCFCEELPVPKTQSEELSCFGFPT